MAHGCDGGSPGALRGVGGAAVLGGGGARGLRPRRARRGAARAAAGADLGSDAEHRVAGVGRRPGRGDARRDGRRRDQRRHRPPADDHLDRHHLLGADPGLRLRAEPVRLRRAALPRRPRPRGRPAHGDRDGQRVRPARPRRLGDHRADDRLPRRRGAPPPCSASCSSRATAGRRCSSSARCPRSSSSRCCGATCRSRRRSCGSRPAWPRRRRPAASRPATRSASCSTTAWRGPPSRSGSPRSWACCWSTA